MMDGVDNGEDDGDVAWLVIRVSVEVWLFQQAREILFGWWSELESVVLRDELTVI
jgi:hypothetical protein